MLINSIYNEGEKYSITHILYGILSKLLDAKLNKRNIKSYYFMNVINHLEN